jgi:hypothetical protein
MSAEQLKKTIKRIEQNAGKPQLEIPDFELVVQRRDTPAIAADIATIRQLRRDGNPAALDVLEGVHVHELL